QKLLTGLPSSDKFWSTTEYQGVPVNIYTATARLQPGRKFWSVQFRHPLKPDSNQKPGRKMSKGLGTDDEVRASLLVRQLNELLQDESLWSVGARDAAAARGFDSTVLEIFYDEVEARPRNARTVRDMALPMPDHTAGYARVMLLGVPGAGK